jgi:DNA-binding NarL/FixJ family response regulator
MTTEVARTVGRPPQSVTVVVAHRRESDRASMVRWLAVDDRFSVVAEAADAPTALEAVTATNPDVALLDIELWAGPGEPSEAPGGIQAIAEIDQVRPGTRTVAVADQDDDRAYLALRAGAIGCYLWSDPSSPIANVVAGAARGEGALTPGWAARLVDELGSLSREPGPVPAPAITPTELEVLRRVSSGATPAAIATLHGVTEHVVNLHAGLAIAKVQRHHDDVRRLGAAG